MSQKFWNVGERAEQRTRTAIRTTEGPPDLLSAPGSKALTLTRGQRAGLRQL